MEINEDTVIDEPGTYYIFARTAATKNYEAAASEAVMLIVSNDVASVVSADGTETKYTALGFALEAANADDIARLLANIGGSFDIYKPITLDLNGKNWSGTATIRAGGTFILTGSGTVNTVALGGKLDVQNDGVKVNALNVTSAPSPAMSLKHGTFDTITITAANITAFDLLADGYAFYDANGVVQNGKVTMLTNVTVMPHEHKIEDNGACECGATCAQHEWNNGVYTSCGEACAHENIDTAYTCITCGAALAASLTANGSTTYYVGLADALNAAGDAGSGTCTVTLLRDAKVTSVGDKGNIADADVTIAPGHGSGDRVLNLNNHSITGGGMINAGRGGNEGYLTITGGGDVKTEIVVNDGRLTLNNFSGTITTVTIDSRSISSDAGTTGRIDTLKLEN